MGYNIALVIAALAPAVALCRYVFKKDRVEKEPIGLLMKLLGLGALACFPAAFCEEIVIGIINAFFALFGVMGEDGNIMLPTDVFRVYTFVEMFIGVALIEEGLKLIILYKTTKNNENFNCLFDGLIYSIFVSLGFAALENVFYVLDNGFGNAIARAVLSVPGHMFFAVMMGYYYTLWKINSESVKMESSLKEKGLIENGCSRFTPGGNKVKMLLIPVLMHAVYNTCCSLNEAVATLALIAFVLFMYKYCFGKIKKMSNADNYNYNYIAMMLIEKYPEKKNEIREEMGIAVVEEAPLKAEELV